MVYHCKELRYRLYVCAFALLLVAAPGSRLFADDLSGMVTQQKADIAMLATKLDAVIEYLKWQAMAFAGLLVSSMGWLLNALYNRGRK